MSEIITVNISSSDEDEEQAPPKKRIKPRSIGEISIIPIKSTGTNKINNSDDVVVLSDEEVGNVSDVSNNVYVNENKPVEILNKNEGDNDSVTCIDDKIEDKTTDRECKISNNEEIVEKMDCNEENNVLTIEENSSEESSGKENKLENITTSDSILNNTVDEASTSTNSLQNILLETFLDICEKSITGSQYEHIKKKQFPVLLKYYKKCCSKLCESANFSELIEDHSKRAKKSPAAAVISFNEIFQYLKDVVDVESIEVSEEQRKKLKKLEKTIKLLLAKIKYLENAEVNFDDEEDSAYLQLERYTNRLNKVYAKYCELLKKNPNYGRITYARLDFVESEYNEINRAISKKYKNNKKFPCYIEMEECIKKVIAENNLELSETKIKDESLRCFKKLGALLQSRRKKELYEAHFLYIRDCEDPAQNDLSLESVLQKNFEDGQVKIEKVCQHYTSKQELGEEPELSEEDSDKSDYVDSENEEKND